MLNRFDLSNRVALVTGAGRGLGASFAKSLAEAGAKVVLTDMDPDNLRKQSEAFSAEGYDTLALPLDVTDDNQIASVMQEIENRFGRLDILINNAGIVVRKLLIESEREDFRRILEVNNVSMMAVSAASARVMKKNNHGRIINVASISSLQARYGIGLYVASKHAVTGFTKNLATELGIYGITANAIAPGYIISDINVGVRKIPGFYDAIVSRTPAARWGNPEDLGSTIVYLASDHSGFVSGQMIVVDGGMTSATAGLPE